MSVARNVIESATGLSRPIATWLAERLTAEETATLSVATSTPEPDVTRTIAADALTRAAADIRPEAPDPE